ncbi:MAG: hypothetical protein VKJ09_15820 [Leptolyngbya sp.]|nr:hypothetical protein [Leptolyngbya sp.]
MSDFRSAVDRLRDDVTGLLFLWNNYVKADPATLTEDAKALVGETEKAFRTIAGVWLAKKLGIETNFLGGE